MKKGGGEGREEKGKERKEEFTPQCSLAVDATGQAWPTVMQPLQQLSKLV